MRYTNNKDLNRQIKLLMQDDWSFKNRSKHAQLVSPDGMYLITVPKSPGDHRSVKNTLSRVRRFYSDVT